ncbi:MAG: hypothetical protein EPN91_04795 [Salinibacterium sp.]|nr:MAG: hypothetical protein EPN91_04795 [Salinibacterium sp.]
MIPRTIVLLGAGASRDAGAPLTSDLAEILVRKMNQSPRPGPEVQALNFVYSAMIGHQGEDGSDPLRAVNIETLVSAVRLLQARESHEVAPFVAAWKAGALGFGRASGSRAFNGRAAKSAVEKAIDHRFPNGDELANLIEGIARDVARPREDYAFKALESALLKGIRSELTNLSSVDYLRPLGDLASAQPGGLAIVTLNYDRTIEMMASEAGIELDTGIERWTPGVPFSFERKDGRINLYKLHGSVDWELIDERPNLRTVRPPKIEVVIDRADVEEFDPAAAPPRAPGLPWIVVGDREKLATDGPTLDLLHAASEAFAEATSLVVVGYSFADSHINAMVRNWMAADPTRTMTVVDPGWPSLGSDEPRGHFATAYGASDDHNQAGVIPRIAVIAESAASGLARGLDMLPSRPEVWATAEWAPDPDGGEVAIRLHGPSLANVTVEAVAGGQGVNVFASSEERSTFVPSSRRFARYVGPIEQGAQFSVFPTVPIGEDSLELTLDGDDLVGHRRISVPALIVPPVAPPNS